MRKKLLSLTILLLFAVSALNVNVLKVSAATYPSIYIEPSSIENEALTAGENITVSIKTDYTGNDVWSYQFSLFFNPSVLEGVQAELANGDIITAAVSPFAIFVPGEFNNSTGELSLTYAYIYYVRDVPGLWPVPLASGPGTLANVTFKVVGYGASKLTLGPDTQLLGFTEGGYGDAYTIIHAEYHPDHIQHGYFRNIPEGEVTHDLAVTSVTPSPTSVLLGDPVDITVVVENQGNVNEIFNVTAYYDDTPIETKTVTNLGSYATTSLTFALDTTDPGVGTYTISAEAVLPGDNDPDDNIMVDGTVTVIEPVYLPLAIITAEETEGYVDESIIFGGEGSYDPDGGTIIAYDWDLGDGTTGTSQTVVNKYNTSGIYTVTLVVTDSQNQVSYPAYLSVTIEELPSPPAYAADLVKCKVKPEVHHWDYSKDVDKLVTMTALAGNLGSNPINVSITFAILDAVGGGLVGPVIVQDATLNVTAIDLVSVLLDPFDYGYDGTAKVVLYAHVTLEYDSDGDGTPDTTASSAIVRFSVQP